MYIFFKYVDKFESNKFSVDVKAFREPNIFLRRIESNIDLTYGIENRDKTKM